MERGRSAAEQASALQAAEILHEQRLQGAADLREILHDAFDELRAAEPSATMVTGKRSSPGTGASPAGRRHCTGGTGW
jgi:hypothetical protein